MKNHSIVKIYGLIWEVLLIFDNLYLACMHVAECLTHTQTIWKKRKKQKQYTHGRGTIKFWLFFSTKLSVSLWSNTTKIVYIPPQTDWEASTLVTIEWQWGKSEQKEGTFVSSTLTQSQGRLVNEDHFKANHLNPVLKNQQIQRDINSERILITYLVRIL